jgi:thiol:disulfide interchange protein
VNEGERWRASVARFMPQAESNEILFDTSGRAASSSTSMPRSFLGATSTMGRSFLYFWVVAAMVLGIVALLLITQRAEQKASVSGQPARPVQSATAPHSNIPWQSSYSSGLALAKKEGKMQMLYFYTDWCGWCQKMEKETFADRELAGFMDKFVPVKINGDRDKQALKKFAISGYPTLVFTDLEGNVVEKVVGFLPANSLREKMETVLSEREKAS